VLDAHGEDAAATWGANDALCAALQIINHLQDCGKDYRDLNRVYLPLDGLAAHGATVEMLGEAQSPPPLRAAIAALADKTRLLLAESRGFSGKIEDMRLAMEVGAIQKLAETLNERLRVADPLSEKVHAGKAQFALTGAVGAASVFVRRILNPARPGRSQ
jgi:hydroxysqualene synthase